MHVSRCSQGEGHGVVDKLLACVFHVASSGIPGVHYVKLFVDGEGEVVRSAGAGVSGSGGLVPGLKSHDIHRLLVGVGVDGVFIEGVVTSGVDVVLLRIKASTCPPDAVGVFHGVAEAHGEPTATMSHVEDDAISGSVVVDLQGAVGEFEGVGGGGGTSEEGEGEGLHLNC